MTHSLFKILHSQAQFLKYHFTLYVKASFSSFVLCNFVKGMPFAFALTNGLTCLRNIDLLKKETLKHLGMYLLHNLNENEQE